MRKITSNTFVSLDGVMQAPGGPQEDTDGEFTQGGWSFHYWDQMMGEVMGAYMGKPFDLLLGRKTYEIFAGFWPNATEEEGAGPLNAATKYVVSTTLETADWPTSILIKYDVVNQIKALKAGEGPEIQVHGSANLLQTLIANNLIDEYQLIIFPLILGRGKRLFEPIQQPTGFQLISSQTSSTGVIIAKYVPAGEIQLGSFAND